MICEKCATIADANRRSFDKGFSMENNLFAHPEGCGCACQHRRPTQWDKFFSVRQPYEER